MIIQGTTSRSANNSACQHPPRTALARLRISAESAVCRRPFRIRHCLPPVFDKGDMRMRWSVVHLISAMLAGLHGLSVTSPQVIAEFPSPTLKPLDVVHSQLDALQAGDNQRAFRFASPECKRATGVLRPLHFRPYYRPPDYCALMPYAEAVGASHFDILETFSSDTDRCRVRVRVWPDCVSSDLIGDVMVKYQSRPSVLDWLLARQPLLRPACYEDDPMQMGISAGPPGAGCWMVDEVKPPDRRDRDRDYGSQGGPGDGPLVSVPTPSESPRGPGLLPVGAGVAGRALANIMLGAGAPTACMR